MHTIFKLLLPLVSDAAVIILCELILPKLEMNCDFCVYWPNDKIQCVIKTV